MARVDMKWGGVYRSGSKEGCEAGGGKQPLVEWLGRR